MNDTNRIVEKRLKEEYEFFARFILKIRDKQTGLLTNFQRNRAQEHRRKLVKKQLQETGKVRQVIVKARQMGMSTDILGEGYHDAVSKPTRDHYIITHEANATHNLFSTIKMFHDNTPDSLRPNIDTKNRNEMVFSEMKSRFKVGTAGSKQTARSTTLHFFHGSEVGFWENAEDICAGAMQAIPRANDTYVYLESTGNGQQGYFYETAMEAAEGDSEWQLLFLPWHWQEEYQAIIPPEKRIRLEGEEPDLKKIYQLTDEQIYWRRLKIKELKGERLFKQEYPISLMEAFQSTGKSFLDPMKVAKARTAEVKESTLRDPLIIGVDPAGGGDRTVFVHRRGRIIPRYFTYKEMDDNMLLGLTITTLKEYKPDLMVFDHAYGYAVVQRCQELGFGHIVKCVKFQQSADNTDRFARKLDEMCIAVKDWFDDDPVKIPDSEEFVKDLLAIPEPGLDSQGRFLFPPKKKSKSMRDAGIDSPDIADGVKLTFAFQTSYDIYDTEISTNKIQVVPGGGLRTLQKRRRRSNEQW